MLIAVEGVHSAGKSTQIAALAGWLAARGLPYLVTRWNSADPIGPQLTRMKIEDRVRPVATTLLEAADLALRWDGEVRDALAAGRVVVADRYVYTGVARAVLRRLDESWARSCFSFAPEPDLVFLLGCPGEVTLLRRRAAGLRIDGHLCGADHEPVRDVPRAFVRHQDRFGALLRRLVPAGTVELDGERPAGELHETVVGRLAARLAVA